MSLRIPDKIIELFLFLVVTLRARQLKTQMTSFVLILMSAQWVSQCATIQTQFAKMSWEATPVSAQLGSYIFTIIQT